MPAGRPQFRFLLRGSLLLIAMLSLWWFLLLNPLLLLLRVLADIPMRLLPGATSAQPIHIEDSGDWTCRIPVDQVDPASHVRIRSIEFTVPRSDVVLFTFSLPVYWAIFLAAPAKRIRTLLWGTGLVSAIQTLALISFLVVAAHTVVAEGRGSWFREFVNYLVVNVIPPAAPFLVALSLHDELRSQIFAVPQTPRPKAIQRADPAKG